MKWLRPWLRRKAVEKEMDTELRFHFQGLVDDYMKQGMSRDEASRRARLEFGGMEQVKEGAREARITGMVEGFWRGLRMAARSLARTPGFTAVALLTLAMGIGVNTVAFSLFDQVILRNIPVKDPERLVALRSKGVNPGMDRNSGVKMSFSYPKYLDLRDHCEVFSGVLARFPVDGSLTYNGSTEPVNVELVTGNFFDVLGVPAAAGRLFTPADNETRMGHPLVVLGYSYWQRRFAGDPSVIGRQLTVSGASMTVIGVSARGFHSVDRARDIDLRAPMMMKDVFTANWRGGLKNRFWAWLNIMARVKPGIPIEKAEAAANVLYRQMLADESKQLTGTYLAQADEFRKRRLELLPAAGGISWMVEDGKTFLLQLGSMTLIVLLIACVNLAGLLMARTAARQRELAIRLALGSGRWGVARQLMAENLLLAAAGGALGVLLAWRLGTPAIRFLVSEDALRFLSPAPDPRVLLFALGITTFTAMILALAPVAQIAHTGLAAVLKSESGASAGLSQVRFRKGLVAAQLALCVWLMIAAGLFARSLAEMKNIDLGFQQHNLITFTLDPMLAGIKDAAAMQIFDRVRDAVAGIPGVSSAAYSDYRLLGGGINIQRLDIDGYEPPRPGETDVKEVTATADYMRTVGLHFLAGRDFTSSDIAPNTPQGPKVHTAIVNQAFAAKYFHGQNPVGRHMRSAFNKESDMEIVGLVRDAKYFGLRDEPEPVYFIPTAYLTDTVFYARTAQSAESLTIAVRKVVEREAPGVPILQMRTMQAQVDRQLESDKMITALAILFGLLATFLAAVGLYGVMAYTISRRTREIGVRMALGAARRDVLRLVIAEVGWIIGFGLLVGLPSGMALARLLRSQLYHISPMDPGSTAAAAVAVAALTMLAGFVPARRATRVDPIRALRWD